MRANRLFGIGEDVAFHERVTIITRMHTLSCDVVEVVVENVSLTEADCRRASRYIVEVVVVISEMILIAFPRFGERVAAYEGHFL